MVHRYFCSSKEGEVTLGVRRPVSQEANLSPVQPTWESSRTAVTLRRDPEIIQTSGKTSQKRKLGHDSITMSHMEMLFYHWGGFIL